MVRQFSEDLAQRKSKSTKILPPDEKQVGLSICSISDDREILIKIWNNTQISAAIQQVRPSGSSSQPGALAERIKAARMVN